MALANLAKLKILVEDEQGKFDENDPIEVLFNPNQITFQKSAAWKFTPAATSQNPFPLGRQWNLDAVLDTKPAQHIGTHQPILKSEGIPEGFLELAIHWPSR